MEWLFWAKESLFGAFWELGPRSGFKLAPEVSF